MNPSDYGEGNVRIPEKPFLLSRHALEWKPALGRIGQSTTQLTQTGITLATAGGSAGAAAAGASSAALIGGLTIGSAIPILGTIAGMLAGILVQVFSGCGSSCTLTSQAANQVEQALQQNLTAYLNGTHTKSEQAAALANFDNTWAKLVQYCGSGSFGSAGQRCVTDREQGSCAYKTSPGGYNGCTYTFPGANNSGSTCWNWFVGYRDPIANDPCVVPDATVAATPSGVAPADELTSTTNAWSGLISSDSMPLFLIGAILVLAVIL